MTGHIDFNKQGFEDCAEFLIRLGISCLVPGSGEAYTESEVLALSVEEVKRHWYMRKDFGMVLAVESIVLLPGWMDSQGARAEVLVAQELGLSLWEYFPQQADWMERLQPLKDVLVETSVRVLA